MEQEQAKTTGRIFTIALHKDKKGVEFTREKAQEILNDYIGTYEMYAIEHNKDQTKNNHWHFIIMAKTPRKIGTIANIFNVETNMIQIVHNKVKMMRYLIHIDNQDKEQYQPDEVITNSVKDYKSIILADQVSDLEIFNDLMSLGYEGILKYIDVVNPLRLATIQRLIGNERQKNIEKQLYEMRALQESTYKCLMSLEGTISGAIDDIKTGTQILVNQGFPTIAQAIDKSMDKISSSIDKIVKSYGNNRYLK